MQESEERFRAFAENATAAIFVIDEESRIDFANPAFAFVAAVKKAQSLDQKKIAEALQTVEF